MPVHHLFERLGGDFAVIEVETVEELAVADTVFGPAFEPLAEAIVREGVSPRIICESAGTQAEDALFMKQTYLAAFAKQN